MIQVPITYAILAICWEKMLTHMVGIECLNLEVNPAEQSVTSNWEDIKGTLQPYQVREHLLQWITRSLYKYGNVVLYTCRDNAMISIEDYDAKSVESLEEFTDIPELKGTLYIAND